MLHFTIDRDGLHPNPSFEATKDSESRVCIISLIGKSRLDSFHMKSGIFNSFIRTDIFNLDNIGSKCNCFIEGYFHRTDNILLLHLVSKNDSSFRMQLYKKWGKEESGKDHGERTREANHDYMRALLFVFSVSHIVMVSDPGSSFDISYIRLFKQIDMLRNKLQPTTVQILESSVPELDRNWIDQGRPCAPRVLFLFESCLLSTDVYDEGDSSELEVISKAKSKKLNALRELQHAVEEMIFKVFRREKIVSNTSGNTLATISTNEDFVYILSEEEFSNALFNPTQHYSDLVSEACSWPETIDDPSSGDSQGKPTRYSASRSSSQSQPSGLQPPQRSTSPSAIDADIPTLQSSKVRSEDEDLRNFLRQHVDAVLKKGPNGEVSKELVSVKTFQRVVEAIHGLFWAATAADDTSETAEIFRSFFTDHVDIELKFSEMQCSKVFNGALSAYKKDLPEFYSKKAHLNKLDEAIRHINMNARGPSVQKYLLKLEKECSKIWKDGRRSCEKISLKGHPCCNQLHRSEGDSNESSELPVMEHRSNVITRSTCNCGRFQEERIDPFNHKAANYDFFEELERRCCSVLEHHVFPTHVPSGSSIDYIQKSFPPAPPTPSIHPRKPSSARVPTGIVFPLDGFSSEEGKTERPEEEQQHTDSDFYLKMDKLSLATDYSLGDFGTYPKFCHTDDDSNLNSPYKRTSTMDLEEDNRDFKLSQGNDLNHQYDDDDDDDDDDDGDGDVGGRYKDFKPMQTDDSCFKGVGEDEEEEDDGKKGGGEEDKSENPQVVEKKDEKHEDEERGRGGGGEGSNGEEEVEEDEEDEDDDDEEEEETMDDTSIDVTVATEGTCDDFGSDEEDDDDDLTGEGGGERYLVGMVNSESPKGLLPLFPSWSLVRLGKYASYESSVGIDQPGFTHQSNYLLPVDIKIQSDAPESWSSKPLKSRISRLYIGLEYECSKAHRFLLCSPTKMLKVPPGAPMKETGSKVVGSDMPLYFPCSCRSNASQMGQLMRIHVAVPDCDLEVKLKVRVQPGPSPCPIFFPEGGESITLRTGLWVLRLPYVYFDGTRSYLMPGDQKSSSSCRLLKGCLTVLEKRTTT